MRTLVRLIFTPHTPRFMPPTRKVNSVTVFSLGNKVLTLIPSTLYFLITEVKSEGSLPGAE